MSEQNKAVVRRYMEALNQRDLAALDDIFSPNYANHSPRIGVTGKDATLKDYEQAFQAFPDRVGAIEELIAEGDKVFLRQSTRTTFKQPMPGIATAPTGKEVGWTVWSVLRFVEGRIVERWAIHDMKDRIERAAQKAGN